MIFFSFFFHYFLNFSSFMVFLGIFLLNNLLHFYNIKAVKLIFKYKILLLFNV